MEYAVLAIGGSIVGQADATFLQGLTRRLAHAEGRVFVVVGGGRVARQAIAMARAAGVHEDMLDRIGIQATRLNAQILLGFLAADGADCNAEVPTGTGEAADLGHRVVVMGGTTPGHSTDYVAAELAQAVGAARLVIATNVDGVYDKDPQAHKDARRLERLDFEGLAQVVGSSEWRQAGQAGVVDGPATVLLRRHPIETRVVDGRDLDNLTSALAGGSFDGTLVAEGA